jgi:hypothetical protein
MNIHQRCLKRGTGSSVRPVSPSDNRGAGAYLGNKLRNYPDGTRVRLK